ncbi:hypothetical protein SeLEV6574_g01722 [Synchytrium endobioticum]|uniref:Uncharacterized protein n=1 Tax=Synchytrium endobioticum TaxID=286115 RepID=A0A507DDS7_9FUNG|nr:hypothetical protein SeLEV6574_g01722 [Synchytrium endobioticum]
MAGEAPKQQNNPPSGLIRMESFKVTGLGHIPKFDGKPVNYKTWRNAVEDVARINDVSGLITDDSDDRYTDAQWIRIDSQFLGVLLVSMTEEVRNSMVITASMTTATLLIQMDKCFNATSTTYKYKILNELLAFRQNGRPVAVVTNEFKVLAANVRASKFDIEDLLTLIYINGFDPDYDILKMVIQANSTTPEFDDVVYRMMNREIEVNRNGGVESAALRLEADRRRQVVHRDRFTKVCINCKRVGHTIEGCWRDGGGAMSNRPSWFKNDTGRTTSYRPTH